MRLTNLFGKTLRETPSEAENISHQLLLRAGMISQVAAGVYSHLPLAWRALKKIEQIIREEMDRIGGQELMMPVLQPLELWEETGRDLSFGNSLFTLSDRRERRLALGPTHEEVITQLVRQNVQSYRDLPLMLFCHFVVSLRCRSREWRICSCRICAGPFPQSPSIKVRKLLFEPANGIIEPSFRRVPSGGYAGPPYRSQVCQRQCGEQPLKSMPLFNYYELYQNLCRLSRKFPQNCPCYCEHGTAI